MNRREFIGTLAAAPLAARTASTQTARRRYEVATRVEIDGATGPVIVWVPLPMLLVDRTPCQTWSGDPERFRYRITAREM